MRGPRLAVVLILSCAVLLSACSADSSSQQRRAEPRRSSANGLGLLTAALQREGIAVSESTSATGPGLFANAAFTELKVNDATLSVWLFDSSSDASSATTSIDRGGTSYRRGSSQYFVTWAGRPRFFRRDAIIVLYLEDAAIVVERNGERIMADVEPATDEKVMRALTSFAGTPFAGAF